MTSRTLPCSRCGNSIQRTTTQADPKVYCKPCQEARWTERRKVVKTHCATCQQEIVLAGRQGLERARQPRTYCSKECRHSALEASSRAVGLSRAAISSARMKANNPMRRRSTRKKMVKTLRAIGHKPRLRGGNGHVSEPERRLRDALGWAGLSIPTKVSRGRGYPTAYKVDVGSLEKKIAVDIDGVSHTGRRKKLDSKKDAILRGLGWTVLRFSNQDVMERLEECVQTVLSTTSK